jgi:phospholipid/cholesterol/gamma-HCH transport system substrate-binding protein
MSRKTPKFMVGLFVTVGVILGVVVIIWVGATKYFEKGNRYVTYFDESVQGLQQDSTVKYRGVEVGRVEQIRVAPDNRLIAVTMKVNLREDLPRNAVAQLKVAGITGLVFVELDRRKPDEPDLSPKIAFPSEYPIIPSRPSEIQKILAGVNVIMDKFNQIDTQAIFNQFTSTAAEIETFFRGKKMEAIMTNLEATSTNLQKITGKAGGVEAVLTGAKDALQGTRALVAMVTEELRGLNLREAIGKTQAVTNEVKATSENLRRASESLESFANRVNDRPSDLLFGNPPRKRWNE